MRKAVWLQAVFLCFIFPLESRADEARARAAADRVTPLLEKQLAEKDLKLGSPIFIRTFKQTRELEIWVENPETKKFVHFKTWEVFAMDAFDEPDAPNTRLGPKEKKGDGIAPEGFYYVNRGRMKPDSAFHLAFNLGYPNAYDRHHKRTGSALMVHGKKVSVGCYAMSDPGIEQIYTLADAALKNGQPFFRVHCFPFRLTDDRWEKIKADNPEPIRKWFPFWENLKEGFDWFEEKAVPPDVNVKDGKSVFSDVK